MNDLFPALAAHDPGGKVMIPLAPDVTGWSVFGQPNDCYRYKLTRVWVTCARTALVVMMNPSTANPRFDDPTIAKVTRMARRWQNGAFGCLLVGNVFAYRATDQNELARVADPVGPDNDQHLMEMARMADLVVFAYGAPKTKFLQRRGPAVVEMLTAAGIKPHVLRLGANAPWHPLYLPDNTEPSVWPAGLAWSPR